MLTRLTADDVLREIYASDTVQEPDGTSSKLHSQTAPEEGRFLRDLIAADPSIKRTLEVGCAYGLSSLWICSALQNRTGALHTILDPLQTSYWRGIGRSNLERANLACYELREEWSEAVLPDLAHRQETFDLIFIDGHHTFDQVMVESYYAIKLLRDGGLLVFDDTDMPAVARVVSHLETYPCMVRHGGVAVGYKSWKAELAKRLTPNLVLDRLPSRIRFALSDKKTMAALRKIKADDRAWDWHQDF